MTLFLADGSLVLPCTSNRALVLALVLLVLALVLLVLALVLVLLVLALVLVLLVTEYQ
jgi:hypothetical protein